MLRALVALCAAFAAWPAYGQGAQFAPPDSTPFSGEPPPATLDGTIQPLDPAWDPYADPSVAPPSLLPESTYPPTYPGGAYAATQRFLQQVKLEYTFLAPGHSFDDMGVNEAEINGTFAVPFYYAVAPLLITPGFAVDFFDGPTAPAPDIPPQTYGAYLDIGWRPQLSPSFSLDLGFRPGVYSDFHEVNSHSLRLQGRALGVYTVSPRAQVVAGIVYLDRLEVKLLPAGGLIWTPNEDTRYEILFPRPKLAQRISTVGNTDWWVYLAGEYGGGSWTYERVSGLSDQFDYNDLRVSAGLEWMSFNGMKGYFELGYVFGRQLVYRSPTPKTHLDDTIMVRGGISW